MEIKSLQQFNAALDFITEKHEAYLIDMSEAKEIRYQFDNVPLSVFNEIAELYNQFTPSAVQGRLSLPIYKCKGTMCVFVHSVQVKACINYEEA